MAQSWRCGILQRLPAPRQDRSPRWERVALPFRASFFRRALLAAAAILIAGGRDASAANVCKSDNEEECVLITTPTGAQCRCLPRGAFEPAKGHGHWDARLPSDAASPAHSEPPRAPAVLPSAPPLAPAAGVAPPSPAAPPAHSEHRAPAASPSSSPLEPAAAAVRPGGGEPSKATLIQFTAHAPLHAEGGELAGYGLYSYALLTSRGSRANFFLAEILKHTPATKPTDSDKGEINLLEIPSIPGDNDKCNPFADAQRTGCPATVLANPADVYDVAMAIRLLAHVCASASSTLADFCSHGFEGGPYLLTYAKPVTKLTTIAPPLLLVDLTGKPESVFAEYLAAYEDQVKSADPTDGAKINTFRLSLLTWLSRAANAVGPISDAAAGILNIVEKKVSE